VVEAIRVGVLQQARLRTPTPDRPVRDGAGYWRWKPTLVLILGFFACTTVWSVISVLKFYGFQAQVYDLGISMEELWQVTNNSWSPIYFVYVFLYEGIRFPLAWIPYLNNYPFLLVFQAAFIAFGAFPIYGIAREYGLADAVALPLAMSYFAYFPLAGVNWYDFHLEALFPTLFLTAFYLFIRHEYLGAGFLFAWAGLVRYPYIGFVLAFAAVLVLEQVIAYVRRRPLLSPAEVRFALVMAAFALAYILAFHLVSSVATVGPAFETHFKGGNPAHALSFKLLTVLLIFLPIAILLPYTRRWPLFILPFIGYCFVANYQVYYYPILFLSQYSVLFVPFVYLSALEGLHRYELRYRAKVADASTPLKPFRWRRRRYRVPVHVLSTVVVGSVLVMALYLEPFGPLRSWAGISWKFPAKISVNWTLYDEFQRVASYIPPSAAYVLFQEDMPSLLPRALPYGDPMIPTIATFGKNISVGHFPLLDTISYTWVNARIDYVIAFPYQLEYFAGGVNASMIDLMSQMYPAGGYGFVAQIDGISLLERGYSGPIQYYIPFSNHLPAGSIPAGPDAIRYPNGIIQASNPNGSPGYVFARPYTPFYMPGHYAVTFQLMTSLLDHRDTMHIRNPLGENWTISYRNFSAPNTWTNITETFDVGTPIADNTMVLLLDRWAGNLTLGGMAVDEVGAPLLQ
jgi:uncharacterized membrane protein